MKTVEKIVRSKYAPLSKEVIWLDLSKNPPALKHYIAGKWELITAGGDSGSGSYTPPAGGIPKTDLAQSVQNSLDKADAGAYEIVSLGEQYDFTPKTDIDGELSGQYVISFSGEKTLYNTLNDIWTAGRIPVITVALASHTANLVVPMTKDTSNKFSGHEKIDNSSVTVDIAITSDSAYIYVNDLVLRYIIKDEKVYPVSHPDISTQASLLPQRFGNLDLYEKLIPTNDLDYSGYYLAYGEEKGMVITSCFLISNTMCAPAIVTITRDATTIDDESADTIGFFCSGYTTNDFDYILVQYYIPTNPAYYYDEESSESSGEQPGDVDEIGSVTKNSSNLSVSIDDDSLPAGTYTMVYEDSTGTPLTGIDEITAFTIS